MADAEPEDCNLNQIWRACRKIQATIFRYGFDISMEFCKHDPQKKGLISEPLFSSILGKYKNIVGLSDFELREVTDYFRLRDGRVAYDQFCKVVCQEAANEKPVGKDMATGLEWNDPMHVNVIPHPEDRRRLCLLLIKIAQVSSIPLLPYFQDYELVSHHAGTVTVAHFSRVLHFMKIPLSDADFVLLLKRYMKDSYMVNYVAFIKHLQNVTQYFREHQLLDNTLKIIHDFPGKLIDLDLPEICPISGTKMTYKIFKDTCHHPKLNKRDCDVVICIQKYIHQHRVRAREFLEGFDQLNTGTITINQFERGLHNMGVGKLLSQGDFRKLYMRYLDPIDTNRVMWREFESEIDRVFTIKNLEKKPLLEVVSPPQYIVELARPGALDWHEAKENVRDICEDALAKIQTRIRCRRLHMHPFFQNYDKLNSGHVRCNQTNQVFLTNGILLSQPELNSLFARYGNELGFNYRKFLEDADPAEYAIPKLREPVSLSLECPAFKDTKADRESEEYLIRLLSSAKRQAIVKNIAIMDFLKDYDRHREGEVLESDFRRGLDNANIKLDPEDVTELCKIFRSPKRACRVLYRDFIRALDEIFIQMESTAGDGEITTVPIMHLANLDCFDCFLNFEERTVCSRALMKLARKPDEISNLSSVFKDFDQEKCGTIRENQFLRGLTVREMNHLLSGREYECVCKCFGVTRGLHREFNYREFLNVLDMLYQTGQVKRNY